MHGEIKHSGLAAASKPPIFAETESVQAHVIGQLAETHARSYTDTVTQPGAWRGSNDLPGVSSDEERLLLRGMDHFSLIMSPSTVNDPRSPA